MEEKILNYPAEKINALLQKIDTLEIPNISEEEINILKYQVKNLMKEEWNYTKIPNYEKIGSPSIIYIFEAGVKLISTPTVYLSFDLDYNKTGIFQHIIIQDGKYVLQPFVTTKNNNYPVSISNIYISFQITDIGMSDVTGKLIIIANKNDATEGGKYFTLQNINLINKNKDILYWDED